MSDGFSSVAASLIGAGIAIVGLVISKENKVSEFRQQWIDGLRADVSSMIATAAAMQIRPIQSTEHFRDLILSLKEFECRIALRFKKADTDSEKLMDAVRDLALTAPNFDSSVERCLLRLQEATQEMLKSEWERVKVGEKVYVKTLLYARFAAIGLAIIFSVWLAVSFATFLITWLPEQFKG